MKGIACIVGGATTLSMRQGLEPNRISTIFLSLNMDPYGKAKDMRPIIKRRL
jgi:hypothetical protein